MHDADSRVASNGAGFSEPAGKQADSSNLLVFFTIIAVLLVASFAATYMMGVFVLKKEQEFAEGYEMLTHVKATISTLQSAESGQRGYLLTSDPQYLEPYTKALTHIRGHLKILKGYARGGHLNEQDFARLDELIERKLQELDQTVDMARSGKPVAALGVINSDVGESIMGGIRTLVAHIEQTEKRELKAVQKSIRNATIYRTSVFAIAVLLNIMFTAWTYTRIRDVMGARNEAARDAQRQRDLLATTLASIGDAVIVTNNQGRITFLNEVARTLTGWTREEAIGQPCTKVFRIVSEETGDAMESPVDQLLRHGRVVERGQNTLLLARHGNPVSIDESGAAIRDRDRNSHGVVLVFRDVSVRRQQERQLLEANRRLESANAAKDQFLATLSHELRTPLTPVIATLSMWEVDEQFPQGLLEDVQMLRRNVELEARLIDDLLDLTRIAKGKMPINLEIVDVHDLLESVGEMFESEVRAKNIRFELKLDADRHHARVDSGRMQQVFMNLFKNAMKFTPPGQQIDVVTRDVPDHQLAVEVRDTGIGMSPDTVERLFRPFEQADAEVVRRAGGLGLGLAVCRALLEAQGGSITASSAGENCGSVFKVVLPVVEQAQSTQADLAPMLGTGSAVSPQLHILLIEDHADTAEVMRRLLTTFGHEVVVVNSAAAALAAVSAREFDLIISDIGLPDDNGFELLPKLRAISPIRVAIALTGFGMEDDIARSEQAGFEHHLTKPVNYQKLSILLRSVVERVS